MNKIKLYISNIKLALQKRSGITKNTKSYENWLSKEYDNTPEVTVIIQSHNKSAQVSHLIPKLREFPHIEIIVIDDGSDLIHTQTLAQLMTRANEFLLRSNDLYENIMYDRTLRMANGKYIALLQDDDDFENLDWIYQAIKYFNHYPSLVILGGKDAIELNFTPEKGYGKSIQPKNNFDFVPAVNRAPMWINKTLYTQYLRHINFDFAPFQYDDYELCTRAWLSNLQVGWYNAHFKSLSVGGMRVWNQHFTIQQCKRNERQLYNLFSQEKERINSLVEASRQQITKEIFNQEENK